MWWKLSQFNMADFLITLCYTHLNLFVFSRKHLVSDLTLISKILQTLFLLVSETPVLPDVSLLVLSSKGCKYLLLHDTSDMKYKWIKLICLLVSSCLDNWGQLEAVHIHLLQYKYKVCPLLNVYIRQNM